MIFEVDDTSASGVFGSRHLRRDEMKICRLSEDACAAKFVRFFHKVANRLKKLHEIQGLFQQGTDTGRQRVEKLVGTGGDQNDRQQRILS
jgi:hypothetical protein